MELFSYFDLHLMYLLVFSLALAFGAGSSLLGGLLTLTALRDGKIHESELSIIMQSRMVGLMSFILYAFSGLGLFTLSYESMIALDIFWASQTIVLVLAAQIALFWVYALPRLRTCTGLSCVIAEQVSPRQSTFMVVSEIVVTVSWVFLMIHHVLYSVPLHYLFFLGCYTFTITGSVILYVLVRSREGQYEHMRLLKRFAAFMLVVTLVFLSLGLARGGVSTETKPIAAPAPVSEGDNSAVAAYTPEEVALHSTVEDCWVIIDQNVYDATDAVAMYPDIYTCGADVTEKYRTVVSEGVSERMAKKQVGAIGYTREEVALHNTKKDCWLIIDAYVFNATKESMLHPAAFHCGADVTENYHKNHGDSISDKMMQYRIGVVDEGVVTEVVVDQGVVEGVLTPYRELYVKEGAWDPHELMVVVEKDAEKLLVIDGRTHEPVGRIHDIGYQPHTSVYTPDAQYMFLIARNGWLTKVDLTTLEPVKTIKVGVNSRGTALTDNGTYLVVGNYEPGNAVVIDPVSMEILKTIPTTGTMDGKEIESRVGAVVEDGDAVILALKDLNSVWVIDTTQADFPVTHAFANIGDNKAPLHDAFLTPDGKYYIVASMGSDTVWVLNTDTWEKVTEVKTGKTPHTGPGAAWGNNVFVPALGEGLITVIDTTTWEGAAQIKTGGPGLFVRSYLEDPSYPYVWAETAFGEHEDEIYVIDARKNEIIQTLTPVPGKNSWHPEFTNNGAYVYVVSQSGNKIVVYDAHTFAVVKEIDAETPSAVSNVGNRIEERGL